MSPPTVILGVQAELALGDLHAPILLLIVTTDKQLYLVINNRLFKFSYIDDANISGFIASYEKAKTEEKGGEIDLGKMVGELIPSIADSLPSVNLDLNQICIAYQTNKIESEQEKAGTLLLGAGLDFKISLADLPLIGAKIPPEVSLSLENFQILYISQTINPKNLNTKILEATKLDGKNEQSIPGGLTISAQLKMGKDTPQLFIINIGGNNQPETPKTTSNTQPLPSGNQSALATKTSPKPSAADASIFWLEINKTLGPVNLQQIGVQYQNSELWFFVNASLSFGGITLACDNLGVGSSLTEFKPKFRLDGLSLYCKIGDVFEIGGAFLRKTRQLEQNHKIITYDEYSGAAILSIKLQVHKLTIAAIGSYTEIEGQASLFVYAFVGIPLGGPPAFFVTGLAAGFGYNRALNAPSIDRVADFPLVKLARGKDDSNKDLLAVLKDLAEYIPPSPGEMFFAVGIQFTSFKIIDAFVLLIVKFGRRLEIYILGLAYLSLPPQVNDNIPVLAQAELAIQVTFIPSAGFIGIAARLTERSYILSKDCKLSGGFAFYIWFSGEHKGDFVLTFGGYHPQFKVPAHYPQVPLNQISWQLSHYLSIKGGAYFALTPSNLMVGGILEASFNQSNIAAWFKIEANFLIGWQPFYYQADVSLEISASVRIETFYITTFISLNLGAGMKIWGPPFSGIAVFKLARFITCQIEFGDKNQQKPEPLSWDNFKASLLPEDICTISIGDGLIGKIVDKNNNKGEEWIINPKELVIVTDSVIPSSQLKIREDSVKLEPIKYKKIDDEQEMLPFAKLADNKTFTQPIQPENSPQPENSLNTNVQELKLEKIGKIGIRPMAISQDKLTITYQVEITINNETTNNAAIETDFSYIPVLKNAPIALWSPETSYIPDNPNEEKFISNTLFGLEIRPAKPPQANSSQEIDAKELLFNRKDGGNYQWETIKNIMVVKDQKYSFKEPNKETNDQRAAILKDFGFNSTDFTLSKSIEQDLLGMPKVISLQ